MLIVALALALAAPPHGIEEGAANYFEDRDPLTDAEFVSVAVASGDDIAGLTCRKGKPGTLRAIFMSGRYLNRTGWLNPTAPLTYRFDKDDPVRLDWWYKEHGAYIESSKNVYRFARRFVTASSLFIRARNYAGDPIDSTFGIRDAAPMVRRLLTDCADPQATQAIFGTS